MKLLNSDFDDPKEDNENKLNIVSDFKRILKGIILLLFSVIAPPIVVIIVGTPGQFAVNLLLTILGWIPGVIHALMIANNSFKNQNSSKSNKNKNDNYSKKSTNENNEWKPLYESQYDGFIGKFELDDWWEKEFTEREKNYISSKKPELTSGNYSSTKSPAEFLIETSSWFTNKEDGDISLKLLKKSLSLVNRENYTELHFIYTNLIKTLYKLRDEDPNYLDECINYCKKDIKLYEEKLKYISFFKENNTHIPSFKRLAIIYEKQNKYEKAVEISKKALNYNLGDHTEGGFKGRLKRLERKLNN